MFLKPKTQSYMKLKCERTQRSQKTSFHFIQNIFQPIESISVGQYK